MKKPALLIGFCIVLSAFFGCKDTKNTQGSSNGSDSLGGKGPLPTRPFMVFAEKKQQCIRCNLSRIRVIH